MYTSEHFGADAMSHRAHAGPQARAGGGRNKGLHNPYGAPQGEISSHLSLLYDDDDSGVDVDARRRSEDINMARANSSKKTNRPVSSIYKVERLGESVKWLNDDKRGTWMSDPGSFDEGEADSGPRDIGEELARSSINRMSRSRSRSRKGG